MKTVKRSVSLALVVAMVFCLAACGSSLSDNNTRTAKVIINAVDDYLDGKTDATTAYNIVSKEQKNIDQDDERGLAFGISALNISIQLQKMTYDGSGDLGKVKDERNNIASMIGEHRYRG